MAKDIAVEIFVVVNVVPVYCNCAREKIRMAARGRVKIVGGLVTAVASNVNR